jgi:hypothetical protein
MLEEVLGFRIISVVSSALLESGRCVPWLRKSGRPRLAQNRILAQSDGATDLD